LSACITRLSSATLTHTCWFCELDVSLSARDITSAIKLDGCVCERGHFVHAIPPYDSFSFYHFPTIDFHTTPPTTCYSPHIMHLTLQHWISMCVWIETILPTVKAVYKPVPPDVKTSLEFFDLLSYVGFLTPDERKKGHSDIRYLDRLENLSQMDLRAGIHSLIQRGNVCLPDKLFRRLDSAASSASASSTATPRRPAARITTDPSQVSARMCTFRDWTTAHALPTN
jgi:hypothetical protein